MLGALRCLPVLLFVTNAAGFGPRFVPPRGGTITRTASIRSALGVAAAGRGAKLAVIVGELKGLGATQAEVEEMCASAIAAAFGEEEEELPPAAPAPAPVNELRSPRTASEAQQAFREAYKGRLVTSETKKYIDQIIEDRACILRFEYTRVYALGAQRTARPRDSLCPLTRSARSCAATDPFTPCWLLVVVVVV
jgi:hypothetical protein